MATVKNYLSLIKFSHTIFAMPFAMIGFFLGINYYSKKISFAWWENNGQPESGLRRLLGSLTTEGLLLKLVLVILCMIWVRSAAMSFNRYLDRNFDARNPRTAVREIPKGIISAKSALIFTIASCILFVVACFFINKLCFY